MSTAPASLNRLADRVTSRLDEFLAAERSRWAGFDAELAHPLDEIRRLEADIQGKIRNDKLVCPDGIRALLATDKVVYLD